MDDFGCGGNSDALQRSSIIAQTAQELHSRGQRCGHIAGLHRLIGMVAKAAGTAQEEDRRGHPARDNHRIVAGAAGHEARLATSAARNSLPQQRAQLGAHRHGRLVDRRAVRNADAALCSCVLPVIEEVGDRRVAHRILRLSLIHI